MVVKLAALTGQPQFRLYVPCKVACRHLKVVDSFRQNCERHAVPFARDTHKDCREIAVVSQFRNTMDWLLHGRTGQSQQHQQQHGGSGQPQQPVHTPVVPQLQVWFDPRQQQWAPVVACCPASGAGSAWLLHTKLIASPLCFQGDPTFLYGGYGYRPPTFGYAWMNGASQPTSHAQLPTSAAAPESAPKPLSK